MTKQFVSEWHKTFPEFTFPEGMPEDVKHRVISRRRQLLVHCYLRNGTGNSIIGERLFTRICKELEEIQAAWGHEYGFYDFLFHHWDEAQEDKLITNNGIDGGVVNHAMAMLANHKKWERKFQRAQ